MRTLLTHLAAIALAAANPTTETTRITSGPKHHFFGYIGHVGNTPWSGDDRYLLALRTGFQDRMPHGGDPAEIVLLDSEDGYSERRIETSRGWNFQQGTMFYWDPREPSTRFFFNDRDPETDEVFCVLFDIGKNERVAEYRFEDTSFGNSGVARGGGSFLGINYGRLARMRPVTGYPKAADPSLGKARNPDDDGIFKVDVGTREKKLLVSYARLADVLRPEHPGVDETDLFINHTLWNPDDSRIFFFARGKFDDKERRIDAPFTMAADGSDLRPLGAHIGGHPEWRSPTVMIGAKDGAQVLFDIDRQEVVGTLGNREVFPNPGGDVALSPDGKWLVNGHGNDGRNYYTFLRLEDGAWARTEAFEQGRHHPDLRVDPGPSWNRAGDRILAVAQDEAGTRQMFVVKLVAGEE